MKHFAGYDAEDLSKINHLERLLSRMSRTVEAVDHDASTFSKFRHSVRISSAARLPDTCWAQVNCAILCRKDAGSPLNSRGLMT